MRTLAVLCLALAACGEPAPRFNVLLVSIDTLRADHLSCYGYQRPTSPALDGIAAAGVRFADANAPSPWTLPSHASLFTGLYPRHHGVRDENRALGPRAATLAQVFSEHGYDTWGIVNAHYVSRRYGLGRGFDRYSQHSEYANPQGTVIANKGGVIMDEALSWLDERDSEGAGARPFFLFLHFYDVHSDYAPTDEFRRRFARPYAGKLDGSTSQLLDLRDRGEDVSAEDVRFLHDLYDAEIAQLDAELARLFRYLDERGLAERTLVVVTSDHGEEFLEHGSLLHGRTQYQEMLHVPLLMRGPGVAAGVTVEAPVGLVDVAPTVLELCGLSFPRNVDGTSLVPYWRDPSAVPAGRPLFAEADHNNAENDVVRMVRVEQMKLCANRRSGAVELFDLSRDRAESENLATSDPERVIVLRERLEEFLASTTAGEELDPVSEEMRRLLDGLGY